MRTFHIGGVVKRELGESEMKTKKSGRSASRDQPG